MIEPKILVVTACGASKHDEPKRAWQLYKSPRIRAVYNRRQGHDMAILSAKYGLVDAETVIEPYEAVLTKEKTSKLISQMASKIKGYDCVVYFKGGAGKEYLDCIREACEKAGKTLVSIGYKMMGDINELPKVIKLVEQGQLDSTARFSQKIKSE